MEQLKSSVPGRLSNVTKIDLEETSLGIDLKVKVDSPLAEFLDSGKAYRNNSLSLSLAKIRNWAAYRGIESAAVPIWLSLKKRKPKTQYTNWTSDLVRESAKLLR